MADTGTSTSSVTLEYKSRKVVDARLQEMMQRVQEKTKSDLNKDELRKTGHALVGCITTKPQFRNLKLKNVEKLVFEKEAADNGHDEVQRPTTEYLETLLSPWLELADFAYTYHDNKSPLELQIQKLMGKEYKLVKHSTDVKTTGDVGYYMAVDDTKKSILLVIKGTSTTSEMITDCLATTIPHRCVPHSPFDLTVDPEQDPPNIGAHEGILASSIKVCNELVPLLDKLVIDEGYKIEISGHSLGAGAASILAVLLRAHYKELHEPGRLHAYCFACPPVLDHKSSLQSKDFITSVANRNDCVTRMAIANVEVMIRMLEGLNKMILDHEGLVSYWKIAREAAFGQQLKDLNDEDFVDLLAIVQQAQAAVRIDDKENLYVPGTTVALYGNIEELPAKGEKAVVTVRSAYVHPSHSFLRYFEVNDRMVSDHYIPAYRESLKACIEMRKETEGGGDENAGCKLNCWACCCCCCNWIFCFPCMLFRKVKAKTQEGDGSGR